MIRVRPLGNIFDDVADVVSDVVDAGGDVIDAVPGGRAVADAVDDFVTGPVRDFARSAVGRTVLSALATTVTAGLAPVLGPQLATVAFALPGMAAGEDFAHAWTQQFGSRVAQTAAILGADAAKALWSDQFDKAIAWINEHGAEKLTSETFATLAESAGIRQDFAAYIIAGAAGDLNAFIASLFDARDGLHKPPFWAVALEKIRKAEEEARLAAQRKSAGLRGASVAVYGVERVVSHTSILKDLAHAEAVKRALSPQAVKLSTGEAPVPPRNGPGSTVALVVIGAAAVGALVWWSRS